MRIAPLIAVATLVGAGVGTWLWIHDTSATQQEPGRTAAGPKSGGSGKGRRFGGDGPVPVTAVRARVADVPVYRDGIGNVQALATVTVRTQVDGKLMAVEFTEGQDVKKGQVLARIDPSTYQAQLDQAVARKTQNEAMLANARLDLERAEKLMSTGAGNRKTEDTARAQVRQLEAQLKGDDAAIDNARTVLGWTTIVAPMDGRTGLRLVDPGNLLRGDQSAIVSLMQVTPIAVVFTLPQRDLAAVNAAKGRGTVPVEILGPDGKQVAAAGELATIDNQIDQATGTVKLKAHFDNAERRLWPGQFVSVRVVVDTLSGAVVVPTAAIRRGPPGTFVYAIGAEHTVRVVPVKLALETETETVIAEGISAGTPVVTIGFARLSDGRAVDVVQPGQPGKGPPEERRRRRDGAPGEKPSAGGGASNAASPTNGPTASGTEQGEPTERSSRRSGKGDGERPPGAERQPGTERRSSTDPSEPRGERRRREAVSEADAAPGQPGGSFQPSSAKPEAPAKGARE